MGSFLICARLPARAGQGIGGLGADLRMLIGLKQSCQMHNGLAVSLAAGRGLAACAVEPTPVNDEILKTPRYLRYTLRTEPAGLYQNAWRSNYLSPSFTPQFPVGSKVDFKLYSATRVDLSFNGLECRMRSRDKPFPTDPEGLRRFIEKHFASTREELNLDSLDPSVRRQIDSGVAAISMTKEQVFMALGYPCQIDNGALADDLSRERIFESNTWTYRFSEIMFITTFWRYLFDNDGKFAQLVQ